MGGIRWCAGDGSQESRSEPLLALSGRLPTCVGTCYSRIDSQDHRPRRGWTNHFRRLSLGRGRRFWWRRESIWTPRNSDTHRHCGMCLHLWRHHLSPWGLCFLSRTSPPSFFGLCCQQLTPPREFRSHNDHGVMTLFCSGYGLKSERLFGLLRMNQCVTRKKLAPKTRASLLHLGQR